MVLGIEKASFALYFILGIDIATLKLTVITNLQSSVLKGAWSYPLFVSCARFRRQNAANGYAKIGMNQFFEQNPHLFKGTLYFTLKVTVRHSIINFCVPSRDVHQILLEATYVLPKLFRFIISDMWIFL